MTARYVLHLNARGAVALRVTRRGIVVLGRFGRAVDAETPPEGAEALFASAPRARWVLIADSVDEELHVEDMPPLRAADRQRMMARRVAQRFRDRRLATWLPLGNAGGLRRGLARWFGSKPAGAAAESGAGSRQQVLLAGLAVDQDLQAWTTLTQACGIRVAGIRSPALLAADVGRGLGTAPSGLLVTVQPAGIRQTLLIDCQPRFTRLAVVAEGRIDAAAVVREVSRVMHYLLMSQVVTRDLMRAGDFVVWVVTDGVSSANLLPQELVVDNSSAVALQAMTAAELGAVPVVDEARQPLPDDDPAAGLAVWARAALSERGAVDYASTAMRAVDRQATVRRAVVGVGSGALAVSMLAYIGVIAADRIIPGGLQPVLSRAEAAELARLEAARVKAPVAGGEIARVVAAEQSLRERAFVPAPLLRGIGQVLAEAVDVRLTSLSWSRAAAAEGAAGNGDAADPSANVGVGGNGLPGVGAGVQGLPSASWSPPVGTPESDAAGTDPSRPAADAVRVLIRAELPEHLNKSTANARAGAIARALGAACRCAAALAEAPFDAEPSTSYSTRPPGELGGGLRFVVELRPAVPVAADMLAGRAATRH
ncbi:MAG: hypothetical protein AB7G13_29375 [Lautropia sp.]